MRARLFLTMGLLAAAAIGSSCTSKGGVGENLILEIIPSSVSFGAVDINTEHKQAIKLTHAGTSGTIRFKGLHFTDATSTEFSVEPMTVSTLEPGESTTIIIHYKPTDSTADSGDLVIEHNVPPDSQDLVHVSSLAPIADLISIPNPIDFGDVKAGEFKDLDVTIRNFGSDVYTMNQIYLRADGSKDFTIISDPVTPTGAPLPAELNPDDEVGLVMRYEPTEGGPDESWLIIDGISKGQKEAFSFLVRGLELGPHIVVSPYVIDFGSIPQDDTATVDLTISNEGNSTLTIAKDGIALDPASPDYDNIDFLVDGGTAKAVPVEVEGLTLEPGESKVYTLQWTAKNPVGNKGDPIGQVVIVSDDTAQGLISLNVFGRVDAPFLSLVPDVVDFGFVGQMITSTRPLSMVNEGTGDLVIGCFSIVDDALGEFDFQPATDFPPTDKANCGPGTIAGNNQQVVNLTFKNLGPDTGSASAKLVFTTNVSGMENVEVPLVAKRAGTPTCEPVLLPSKLDFGVVPKGFYKEKTFKLLNQGTGYCSFKSATIEDCQGLAGLAVTCPEPGTGFGSKNYLFMGLPPAVQNGIGPQGSVFLKVRFTPPDNDSVFGMLMTYPALASAVLYDSQLQKDVVVPAADGGGGLGLGGWSPNLDGDSGVAKISVLPGEVDFGMVTIGCFSQTFKVCLYNTGNAPLTISDI
ncbi:MAG: choice-of-anchor D domain-containing protein [Deltaproteobacteria bacterium]|nr:choice-of-anchor D domain-containing protein [Deltaproteobacteria bacterium]